MGQERKAPSTLERVASGFAASVVVLGAWATLHLWGLEKVPFHTKGEPREAVVVQDMVRRGRVILPLRNGVELPRKPPLFQWLAASAAYVSGALDERSVRLPSAVLSGACAMMVVAAGAYLYGARAGLIAGLFLLTSFEWLRAATSARVDMTLTFGLTLCFVGLMLFRLRERPIWLFLLYGGSAWATLSKGPVGIALPALQVLFLCGIDRSLALARRLRPWRGLPAVFLVTGGWYALAVAEGGGEFFTKQILEENVTRFLGSQTFELGHSHSVGYLLVTLLAGLLPWTIFLPSLCLCLWRARHTFSRRDPRLFTVVWSVTVFAFYGLATSKRGVYLLPVYPALSLLLGWWADGLLRRDVQARWLARILPPVAWGFGAVAAMLAAAVGSEAVGIPFFAVLAGFVDPRTAADFAAVGGTAAAQPGALAALLALTGVLACVAAVGARAQHWRSALAGLLLSVSAIVVAVRQLILPDIAEAQTRRTFAATVRRIVGDPQTLFTSARFDYGTVFYWGGWIPVADDPAAADGPRYLVMSESEWSAAGVMERRRYERVPGLESGRVSNQGQLVLLQRQLGSHSPVTEANSPAAQPRPTSDEEEAGE